MKFWVLILFFTTSTSLMSLAQRPHLEVGGTIGFKDEFFLNPEVSLSPDYMEFHCADIYLFSRISKSIYGGELSIGYEKPLAYFQRFNSTTTNYNYFNLNRLAVQLSPYIYLIKKATVKWDVQIGLNNYFNLNNGIYLPDQHRIDIWKMACAFGTNVTYKSFLIRLFYEYNLKADYDFGNANAIFGIRLGVIY